MLANFQFSVPRRTILPTLYYVIFTGIITMIAYYGIGATDGLVGG